MSIIIGKALIAGGGTVDRLDFTYTGQYNERLEDGVVEFLTSGILKFKKEAAIDAFLVGGGSSGSSGRTVQYNANTNGAGGGGGGYTKTLLNIIPRAGQEYPVIIGSGGAEQQTNLSVGNAGGTTSAFGSSVGGGEVASAREHGSNGGSGGGQGGTQTASTRDGKAGGVAGGNGGYYSNTSNGGIGQGTTTREFGEPTGKLYAGGGGGGTSFYGSAPFYAGAGGDGGGGEGAGYYDNATAGTPNTGGGGGGGAGNTATFGVERGIGAAGGSGIVCIRLHKDDPTENVLSGTWKFNDTLTMPSTLFTENFDYDGTVAYAGSSLYGVMGVRELSSGKDLCFGHIPGDLSSKYVQVYRFTNNTWLQATAKTIKFWNRYQVVSPEFYTWFTANATKISD